MKTWSNGGGGGALDFLEDAPSSLALDLRSGAFFRREVRQEVICGLSHAF